jgi:hypothetical protein
MAFRMTAHWSVPEDRLFPARIAGSIRSFLGVQRGTSHAGSRLLMPMFKWRYCDTCKVLRRDVDGRTMDCGHTNGQPPPAPEKSEDQSVLDLLIFLHRYH